jgi:beta-1,4-mannosyltransferase
MLKVLMLPDCRDANPYQALLATAIEQQGATVHFPKGYRRGLPLLRAVMAERVEILHLHWILPYLKGRYHWQKALYGIKLLADVFMVQRLGVQVIWTVHNQVTHDAPFPELEQQIRRRLAHQVDRLILHNQSTPIAQIYGVSPNKIQAILHGHYRDAYPPKIDSTAARRLLGLPLTGHIYLSLGLLRPYKGIEQLLSLWRDHPEIATGNTLLIAGKASPSYAAELQKQAADLPSVVLMPDFVANDRIHLFFSAASIAVLPYKKVLNSGSLILAMSYGLPVIASKLGSISEYLDTATQLLFEPEDETGLLKAMVLATQTDLEDLRQRTVQACDRLDWNLLGKQSFQVYINSKS